MTAVRIRPGSTSWREWLERPGMVTNLVNGLIVSASVLAVAGTADHAEPLWDCVSTAAAVAVFTIAHAFAEWSQRALATDEPVGRTAVRAAVRHSAPALLPVAPICAPVLLASTGFWSTNTGLWLSFCLAAAALAMIGYETARRRHWSASRTVAIVVLSGAIGCILVLFKQLLH